MSGTGTRSRPLADTIAATSALLLVIGLALTYAAEPEELAGSLAASTSFVLSFGAVGWVLWRRLPTNPLGWCFSSCALATSLAYLGHGWALRAMNRGEADTAARLSALVDSNGWIVSVPLGIALPLLLLPAGRLPSPRWRPLVAVVLAGAAVGAAGVVLSTEPLDQAPYQHVTSPLGVSALGPVPMVMGWIGVATMASGILAGVWVLVRRFRHATGTERQQLRWVAFGGCAALLGVVASSVSQEPGLRGAVGGVGAALGMGALPVCIAVAVLRYRLYDLGRLVSRTVSYAVLTTLLLGFYLVLVTAVTRLAPASSSLAVAASTLAAAALFQPLRRRVQAEVDRRFNRARYDADRTVEEFRRRLRDEVDLAAVRADLLHVVEGTVQPAAVGLWLRENAR